MTTENAFAPGYSHESFLETPGRGEALRRLDDGLGAREPFLLITGDPGTGKTTLAYEAVARWGTRVTTAFLAYPALTSAELLEEIIRRFGGDPPDGASRSKLVACFEQTLAEIAGRDQVAMLIVDDAHSLSPELLGELRLLVNAAQQVHRPLEVLLIGLPALSEKLDQGPLASLRQRFSVRATVEHLSDSETRRYLNHRVAVVGGDGPTLFSKKSCQDIAARTRGVPRQINALAAEALRVAAVWGDPTVGTEHIQIAAAELKGLAPIGVFGRPAEPGPNETPALMPPPRVAERPATPSAAPVARTSDAPPAVRATPAPSAERESPRPPESAPAPPAKPAEVRPTFASSSKPSGEKRETPKAPAPSTVTSSAPVTQDSREWVARFIGDKGPLQISSRAAEMPWTPVWEPELSDASATESAGPAEKPTSTSKRQAPKKRERARGRTRTKPSAGLRLGVTASLTAIAAATVVVLLMRAGSLARRTANVSAVATDTAPKETERPSASTRPRANATPSAARANAQRLESEIARPGQAYTLDVGGNLSLEAAYEQRDRMQALTGFEGWVVPDPNDGERTYRVVLNAYRSRQRAESAAHMLLNSRTLPNVTVVPLPPKDVRR